MNPARHEPEFSIGIAFNSRSLPRCVNPFPFTRSYSERCVRRRVFGNENELTFVGYVAKISPGTSCLKMQSLFVTHRSVQKKSSTENSGEEFSRKSNSSVIARATRQVFPRCQLAIQWRQPAIQW
jgi:hypothetical protein